MVKISRPHIIYILYILALALLIGSIVSAPLLAIGGQKKQSDMFYSLNKPWCHQMVNRSFCLFNAPTGINLGNCVDDSTSVVGLANPATERPHTVEKAGVIGYSFAQDARNTSIYSSMLLVALAYPFFKKLENKNIPPPIFYIIAIVPLAIDGTFQLFGFWESTNLMRFITGIITGSATTIFALPVLNKMFN